MGRFRGTSTAALVVAVIVPAMAARSDIAPPSGAFWAHLGPLTAQQESDVQLVRESIVIDLYPTLIRVRADLTLRGPAGAEWLVGAPQSMELSTWVAPLDLLEGAAQPGEAEPTPAAEVPPATPPPPDAAETLQVYPIGDAIPGSFGELRSILPPGLFPFQAYPWIDVEARVDSVPVEAELRRYAVAGERRPIRSEWWVIPLTVPDGGELRLEFQFVQPIYAWARKRPGDELRHVGLRCAPGSVAPPHAAEERIVVDSALILGTGSGWRGTVERATIRLVPHGLSGAQLCFDESAEAGPDGTYSLTLEDWEPEGILQVAYLLPVTRAEAMRDGTAPYPLDDLDPVWRIHDRLQRFARSGVYAGLEGVEMGRGERERGWIRLVQSLRRDATRSDDEEVRRFAGALLDDLRERGCGGLWLADEEVWEHDGCWTWLATAETATADEVPGGLPLGLGAYDDAWDHERGRLSAFAQRNLGVLGHGGGAAGPLRGRGRGPQASGRSP